MAANLFISLFCLVILTVFACNGPTDQNDKPCPPPTDTTSHNFVWQIDTLGVGNSSQLNDVIIIDENNVWAVGEIYLNDSTGQTDPISYGFANWDGQEWTFRRLEAVGPSGGISNLNPRGIFAFSENDIWFASGGVFHWNGDTIAPYWVNAFQGNPNPIFFTGQTAEKLWGTSSSNLYTVGRQGAIAHFNGTSWRKVESTTTIDIKDIWGAVDCHGKYEILSVASQGVEIPQAKKLLKISGTTVTEVSSDGLPLALYSIWFDPRVQYYIGGDGLFSSESVGQTWSEVPAQPPYVVSSISGLRSNDIAIAGGLGHLSHFNGLTWKHYINSELPEFQGNYIAVALHPKLVVAVGFLASGEAIATIGKR